MLSRRQLLSVLGSLAPIPSWCRTPFFQWQGILELPERTSWKEFCELHNQFMNVEFLNKLEKDLSKAGKIKLSYTQFHGDKVIWTYIFKDAASFENWMKLSEKGVIGKPPTKMQHHSKMVSFYEVDWTHPYLKDLS